MKKSVIIFSILMGFGSIAQAQISQFHAGLAFSSGKFADGDEKKETIVSGKGFAAMGFTVGFKYYNPLDAENLSWLFGIEAYYNGVNSDYKDYIENQGWKDITFPKYLNFPVTVGLNYAIPIQDNVKIYGEAAIGGNFSAVTKYSRAERSGYQDMETKFTSVFGFAYAFEGGLFINEKYSIGLKYNNLGAYKYKYETKYETSPTVKDKYDKKLPITNLSLCVGILF